MRAKSPIFFWQESWFWPGSPPARALLDSLLIGYSLTSWNEGNGQASTEDAITSVHRASRVKVLR